MMVCGQVSQDLGAMLELTRDVTIPIRASIVCVQLSQTPSGFSFSAIGLSQD